MVTEEALPTYMTMLNTLDGVRDETGASQTPWGIWTRAWTAEENRWGPGGRSRRLAGAQALARGRRRRRPLGGAAPRRALLSERRACAPSLHPGTATS
jgi:hypothetical protein